MDTENYMNEKSAFIAIVGRPNVGKSSILNRLLGTKLAIVSNKPQTTRTRIMGVWTEGETQLVFIDTPGLIKPKNSLGDYMVKSVTSSVADVDACLLVVEANTKISKADEELVHRFKDLGVPADRWHLTYTVDYVKRVKPALSPYIRKADRKESR